MPTDGFELHYEEGPCLVVSKPGGLLTQAPPNIDSLEVRVKRFLKVRDEKPGRVYLGVPHRLDRPVSGALVLAKHVRAARRLSEQFEARTVRKVYWAVVDGVPDDPSGTWTDRVRKVPNQARAEVVPEDHPEGKTAILRYSVLAAWESIGTLLEIELETGRTHQIRLQCGTRGLPILGDQLYGSTKSFGPTSEDERQRWIALHARQLIFHHPMTLEKVSIAVPVSEWWSGFDLPRDRDR